jgi:general stress protein 26
MKITNASPGFGTPLTEDEVRNFLAAADSKLNIHLGTVDAKGEPNIHPTWYYFDATNNRFYNIETSKKSMKTENLNRNNTAYYCVDDPNPPYKGVRGKGKVKIHDVSHNTPIAEMIMRKYLGSIEHPMAKSL